MNPTMAIDSPAVICQVRSLKRPLDHAKGIPRKPDTKYGGAVRSSAVVDRKPLGNQLEKILTMTGAYLHCLDDRGKEIVERAS